MRYSLIQGSADSVPVSSLPSSATPCVFSQPATPPVICATWRQYLSRSQRVAHSSRHHGGVAPSAFPVHAVAVSALSVSLWQTPCFQQFAASLSLFALFFALSSFVFNSLQTLLQKHPGWGGTQRWRTQPRQFLRVLCAPVS